MDNNEVSPALEQHRALRDTEMLMEHIVRNGGSVSNTFRICMEYNAKALARPLRNCDMAKDWMELYCQFKPPKGMREMPPEWVDCLMAFCMKLTAPAVETEEGK